MLKFASAEKSFLSGEYGFILYFSVTKQTLAISHLPSLMKLQFRYILILTCLLSVAFIPAASGQETEEQEFEIPEVDREKMLYSPGGEGENRNKLSPPVSNPLKDSIVTTRTPLTLPIRGKQEQAPKATDKQLAPKDEDPDSILSFNFLYYIIEKYKLQDIVD